MKPSVPGRLRAQGLVRPRFSTATDVVRHLACVQSQLPDMALWAIGRRTHDLTLRDLRAGFARGNFVRTHVLRPTWHFVAPDDIALFLALSAPRVRQLMRSSNSAIGLDESTLDRGADVIVAALDARSDLTRAELAAALAEAGLDVRGQSLAHVVMHAEITGLIANGPPRGTQHTYRRLAATPSRLSADELLAEGARRYARGHGPFRDKDLAWWSSLTLTASRRAIDLAQLRRLDLDGVAYYATEEIDTPVDAAEPPALMLLANFDEYISYARDPGDYDAFGGTPNDLLRGSGLLVIDGLIAGAWSRTVTKTTVEIHVTPTPPLTTRLRRALEAESAAFGRFVEREPRVHVDR